MPTRKKRKGKLTRVKVVKPSALIGSYLPTEALKRLNTLIAAISSEIAIDIQETTQMFHRSLYKRMVDGIKDEVLNKEYTSPAKLNKAIARVLKKKAKLATIELSTNDAYQNLNRGELLGAEATGQPTVKQWITQFDSRTRSWHDTVNYQERTLKERFTVPYPGGTDYLKAPKIPPISPSNFINCRCSVQYAIIEK